MKDSVDTKIRCYDNYNDMTGLGEEWFLSANREIIAIFINGELNGYSKPQGNDEVTKGENSL